MVRFLTPWSLAVVAASTVTGLARPDAIPVEGVVENSYMGVCSKIASTISPSAVHYPDSPVYTWLNSHWSGTSDQPSACVAEPRSPSDVSKILRIIGQTRTPFSVKSGGHTTNPGFSSTPGVHISLYSLRSIDYNCISQTVEIGTGLRWDDVYAALEPHNVSVAGSRVTGVGVGGFTLGGGYSWKTNQYGLTVDTVTAFELVKPNGDIITVTENSDSQLFFGLKGASNNFGIVTKITLKTLTQGPVWGGFVTLTCPQAISKLVEATARFSSEVKDPKASVTSTFSSHEGNPSGSFQLFYDGPNPPAGIFDDFLALHTATTDISTRSLLSLVQSINANETYGERSYFDMVPVVDYSPGFLELVRNTSIVAGRETSAFTLYLVAEPFLPTILSHNPSRTAYPFNRSKVYTPFGIVVLWRDPADDEVAAEAVKRIKDTLYTALIAEGQRDIVDAPLYTNYVIYDTPVERIYGSNLPALKRLKARVDPTNVMGLAGGFKV